MAEPSLLTKKKKRYSNGIVQRWSARHKEMRWGWDIRIDKRRYRRCEFAAREQAESELAILRAKLDCKKHGLSSDDIDLSQPLWNRFEAILNLKIGAVGAAAELLVCADLLRRGYEVYRAVASNSACDLIVTDQGRSCRIEVKSAIMRGRYAQFKRERFNPLNHDVLALCFLRDCQIEYRPPIKEWFDGI